MAGSNPCHRRTQSCYKHSACSIFPLGLIFDILDKLSSFRLSSEFRFQGTELEDISSSQNQLWCSLGKASSNHRW